MKKHLAAFFALTIFLAWTMGALGIFLWQMATPGYWPQPQSSLLAYAAGFVPANVAVFLALVLEGGRGLKRLLSGLARWRFQAWLYLLVCAGLPALVVLVSWLATGRVGAGVGQEALLIPLLASWISPSVLGEEIGWRGYALPRLQRSLNPLLASLLIGLLAAASQAWIFLAPGAAFSAGLFLVLVVNSVAVSVLATWLYNRTGGSLLAVTLLRAALAVSLLVFAAPPEGMAVALAALAVVAIFATGLALPLPASARPQAAEV
jgi:membrane protease YdiL (CAAX protease family)